MLFEVIEPYTFNDAGRLQSIFIDPSQSEAAACYFKRKGRVWWDYMFMPETEYHKHKRIKWMSKADVRKADCHPSKLKARSWAEARADRRMKKLRKIHNDACVAQIERESYELWYKFTDFMRESGQPPAEIERRIPSSTCLLTRQRIDKIKNSLWRKLVQPHLRK